MLLPINDDIRYAKTLPKDFYLSTEYFEQSKEMIFATSWHYAGCKEEFTSKINIIPIEILPGFLSEPLLLSKSENEEYFCLPNVCNHRGNIISYDKCLAQHLRCKYHGRLFSLDGKFISMPEFKNVANFFPEDNNLKKLPLNCWGNIFFTQLGCLNNFNDYFGDLSTKMEWFSMDKMQYNPSLNKEYIINCHWALYCENYLEGFHIPFVHPVLNSILDFSNYPFEKYKNANLSIGFSKSSEGCFKFPEQNRFYNQSVSAFYFWVFPNLMFNFYPWGLSLNIVEPLTISTTKVRFLTFILDEKKLQNGAGSGLNSVEMEDEEVVQQVQRGIKSRFYQHGRYAPEREKGTHHFHQLLYQALTRKNEQE